MDLLLPGGTLSFGGVTHLMSVINRSPESEQTDVYAASTDAALTLAEKHRTAGATVIDVGGQSTNLRVATELAVYEELERLIPTVEAIVDEGHIVSVDTWKPAVAAAAIEAGASIINDTGGLADPEMRSLLANADVGVIVMFLAGEGPLGATVYPSDLAEVARGLSERTALVAPNRRLVADPGVGINYGGDYETYTRNQFSVARDLEQLRVEGLPILFPVPRKQNRAQMFALTGLATAAGADMLRVHDTEAAASIVSALGRSVDPKKVGG